MFSKNSEKKTEINNSENNNTEINNSENNTEINTDGIDHFSELPNELKAHIFRFLDYRSLTRMNRVCKISKAIVSEHLNPNFIKYQKKFSDLLKEGLIEKALKYIKNHAFPANYLISYHDEEKKLIERTSVIHQLCQYFKNNGDNKNLIELFHLCLNANADINAIQQKKISLQLPFPHTSFVQQTPLLYAINADNKALFDLLIDLGANVNIGIDPFNNPLTAATNKANGGNIHFLLRLLDEPLLIVPSHVLVQARDKSNNFTWRLIYLRMLKAYILQQSFPPNTQQTNVVNAYLQRIDELYAEASILSSEENPHHSTNAELLQFQNEVSNMQDYIFELACGQELAEPELAEPEQAEPTTKKHKM